ncbi:MAG: DUF58 domain-containing protein, partial [Planctomycetes bacterium]|nr:DUF58 domain-containing protein [Planctomycetota bacterium]
MSEEQANSWTPLGADDILDPAFMKKCARLNLYTRGSMTGASSGDRASNKKGSGMEFKEHKEYSTGDDFRNIDWNVYARLGEFVIKTFEAEENLSLCVLMDCSASMNFGGRMQTREDGQSAAQGLSKYDIGCQIAAALSYIAISNKESLVTYLFNDKLDHKFDASTGKGNIPQLLDFLRLNQPTGESNFMQCFQDAARDISGSALTVIISDFYNTDEFAAGLKALRFMGHEVVVVHVTDPSERNPVLEGEMDFEDAETGEV